MEINDNNTSTQLQYDFHSQTILSGNGTCTLMADISYELKQNNREIHYTDGLGFSYVPPFRDPTTNGAPWYYNKLTGFQKVHYIHIQVLEGSAGNSYYGGKWVSQLTTQSIYDNAINNTPELIKLHTQESTISTDITDNINTDNILEFSPSETLTTKRYYWLYTVFYGPLSGVDIDFESLALSAYLPKTLYSTDFTKTIKSTVSSNIHNDTSMTINGKSTELYKFDNYSTIKEDHTKSISGQYNINTFGSDSVTLKNTFDLTSNTITKTIHSSRTSHTEGDTIELYKPRTIITNNTNTNTVSGFYNINSTGAINITSAGAINLTAGPTEEVKLMSRLCVNNILSYQPKIITTSQINSANAITTLSNDPNHYEIITNKVLNIIYIDNPGNILDGNISRFFRVKLTNGSYNGQVCKVCLHPVFETTFNVDYRNDVGYSHEVIVRIESFCDTNSGEFSTADIVLNRGGMALNMIFTDITNSDVVHPYNLDTVNNTGYWMLIDNNFSQG